MNAAVRNFLFRLLSLKTKCMYVYIYIYLSNLFVVLDEQWLETTNNNYL